MRIPEFKYGLFAVLTVDPFDYMDVVISQGVDGLTGTLLRDEMKRAADVIRTNAGVLVETFAAPPLIGLWTCPNGAVDDRALAAGKTLATAKPVAGLKGPYVALSYGNMLFQEDRRGIINILGPASKRCDSLHRLAHQRRLALVVDDEIARLGAVGEFESIGEGAFAWKGVARA
jgi:hypothetical protein